MKQLLLLAIIMTSSAALAANPFDPAGMVNTFIGTTGPKGVKNYGGVCPWVAPPHAMTDWTPMTQLNFISQLPFRYEDRYIKGFMGTHQPTIWMSDYGFLTVMPEIGSPKVRRDDRAMAIVQGTEIGKPFYYSVEMGDSGGASIRTEITATTRCGFFRITYPKGPTPRLYVEMSRIPGDEEWVHISPDRCEIIGYNPDRMNVYDGKDMGPHRPGKLSSIPQCIIRCSFRGNSTKEVVTIVPWTERFTRESCLRIIRCGIHSVPCILFSH